MSNNIDLPRGYRNNNPLNIRYSALNAWKGKVFPNTDRNNTFEQFTNMVYGYRAALYLLRKYINQGYTTIGAIISKWAPANENNTTAYINDAVNIMNSRGLAVTPFDAIHPTESKKLCELAYAMSIIENGNTSATREAGLPDMDIINEAWNLL